MLVEDTTDLLQNMVDIFYMEGYEINTASNGLEALEKISDWIPDLIVTDLLMPKMDGFALIGKIREQTKLSHIPIIIFSAKTASVNELRGLNLGAHKFLSKPCSQEKLIESVESLLNP